MNSFLENFCPIVDNKDALLKQASIIHTSSSSILEQISKIKVYLKKPNCKNRKLAEKQLSTLKELNKYYKIYKSEKFTKKTNIEIRKLFESIKKNQYIWDFNWLAKKINIKLDNESSRLRDTYIFETNTFRDNVEKNINFVWEYIETKEISLFLRYFTIEYINFLDSNNIKYPNLKNSKIILNYSDLTKVLNKVKFRMKNINYDFELEINLKDWLEKTVKLKHISQKVKIIKKSEKKQDSDKKIKKTGKNTQINSEFNNILEANIIEKINKYTEELYENKKLKKYYKTPVIWSYPEISRVNYIKKIFNNINDIKDWLENIPKWIKEELLKIIAWLPAQESKYDNSALNTDSWAFWIFQFTNINFIDSIKSWRLLKCPFLNNEEKNQINILTKLDKSKIQENPLFKKLKKTFKSSMKKITWASASYFKVLYKKLTKITKVENSIFITTDRKILLDLIKIYNLNEIEKNKFIVYMMINWYNSGWERINILLSNFLKYNKYNNNNNNNNALSLLEEITTFWKKEKGNLVKYDINSSEYVWKVIAWNNAIKKLEKEELKNK